MSASESDSARSPLGKVKMGDTQLSLLFEPTCSVCGKRATSLEIVPPEGLPLEWCEWKARDQENFFTRRKPGAYTLIYSGIAAGSGSAGTPKTGSQARGIVRKLVPEFHGDSVHGYIYDDLGYCSGCGVYYCADHWSLSATGGGCCPNGHGKSLDPLW